MILKEVKWCQNKLSMSQKDMSMEGFDKQKIIQLPFQFTVSVWHVWLSLNQQVLLILVLSNIDYSKSCTNASSPNFVDHDVDCFCLRATMEA